MNSWQRELGREKAQTGRVQLGGNPLAFALSTVVIGSMIAAATVLGMDTGLSL